jgi:hypothetical protein
VGRVPPGDAVSSLGEGRLVYMIGIFILNGMWAQDKMYFGWHFAWVKYFTYHLVVPVLAPNYIRSTYFRRLKLGKYVIH